MDSAFGIPFQVEPSQHQHLAVACDCQQDPAAHQNQDCTRDVPTQEQVLPNNLSRYNSIKLIGPMELLSKIKMRPKLYWVQVSWAWLRA